ncbi:MAG: 5-formyltetrahydrofolate cyclo-ligase [Nevskiaceae bacterium]|nr:MAG: 5-formyltetrahydrofolate cyclo-ligase [Nevskiaceae bacterium]
MRRDLRRRRNAITPEDARKAALLAACHLAGSAWLRRAQHVAVYLDYGAELGTAPLIDALLRLGKHVYVPRIAVATRRMRFLRLTAETPLRTNAYGIAEPVGRPRERRARQMDVIVLPLLGFDGRGQRLGTGGGYYDRALAAPRPFRRPRLIGYGYALQQVDAVPAEPWDIRLDAAATESGLYQF